jgi:hypothetical protein
LKTRSKRSQHSSFLSAPLQPSLLKKISEHGTPALSAQGQATMFLLGRLDGTATISEHAREVAARFPKLFPSEVRAKQFVTGLASRYAD